MAMRADLTGRYFIRLSRHLQPRPLRSLISRRATSTSASGLTIEERLANVEKWVNGHDLRMKLHNEKVLKEMDECISKGENAVQDDLSKRFDATGAKIDALIAQIDNLGTKMNAKFDAVEAQIDAKFDVVYAQIDNLGAKMIYGGEKSTLEKMDAVEIPMGARVDQAARKTDANLTRLGKEMNATFTQIGKEMDATFTQIGKDIHTQLNQFMLRISVLLLAGTCFVGLSSASMVEFDKKAKDAEREVEEANPSRSSY